MSQQSPQRSYIQASSNETSPLSNEDIIAQKILKRVEIAKMTRQLKAKLFKAGMKVRDQNANSELNNLNLNLNLNLNSKSIQSNNYINSSNSSSPMSSPSRSLSEDVTNNITATAISNIQNSKLLTPTKQNFNFDNSTLSMTNITPAISPLKRKSSSTFKSIRSSNEIIYENLNDELASPVKKANNGLNSSPYAASISPYQYSRGSFIQTPQSITHSQSLSYIQPPKTPPFPKEVDIFHLDQRNNSALKPLSELNSQQQNNNINKNKRKITIKQKTNKINDNNDNNDNNNNNENNKITTRRRSLNKQEIEFQKDNDNDDNNNLSITTDSNKPSQATLLSTPKSSRIKEFTTPNRNNDDLGADLLLFLSNSPARNFNNRETKDFSKVLAIPTTPKASNSNMNSINLLESTPLRNQLPYFTSPSFGNSNTPSNAFLQPLLGTPIGISGSSRFQNPATPNNRHSKNNLNRTPGFSMSDYINFTPSPRISRTPDFNHAMYSKPMMNYSKELNIITSIKEDED